MKQLLEIVRKANRKILLSVNNLADILISVGKGKITVKYGLIRLTSQLSLVGLRKLDGVNWDKYHKHYLEELKMTSKLNTLVLSNNEVDYFQNKIRYKNPKIKPLIPSHELLYQKILEINPRSVLEAGCGGGDHLHNIHELNPEIEISGFDYSYGQLSTLAKRHPLTGKQFNLQIIDLTQPNIDLPEAALIFTHAVLMHISEKENRFQNAFRNLFQTNCEHIVLIENWTQHDFLKFSKDYIREFPSWNGATIYYQESDKDVEIKCMVISKKPMKMKILKDYDVMLNGQSLVNH
jgi:trans-aconitate methyltransferase